MPVGIRSPTLLCALVCALPCAQNGRGMQGLGRLTPIAAIVNTVLLY